LVKNDRYEAAEISRRVAAEIFVSGLTPQSAARDWADAVARARLQVETALDAAADLHDVAAAVAASGRHIEVLRYLMAPPVSQDRLAIICPDYPKSKEKSGSTVSRDIAEKIAAIFDQWQDVRRTAPLRVDRTSVDARVAMAVTASLIAQRATATAARKMSSADQEDAVKQLLLSVGWTEQRRTPIARPGMVDAGNFMQKTRMATEGGLQQEVDFACGLDNGVILALECKVSNDVTNSIKRANDVLNKVRAWQKHWGNFVITGAMLQGVFAANDIQKLLDANAEVFWHHEMADFGEWVQARRGS